MGEVVPLIRIKDEMTMKNKMSIIQQIDAYAHSAGLTKKNGAYFKDNRFYGSIYDVGREGGVDMQDGR